MHRKFHLKYAHYDLNTFGKKYNGMNFNIKITLIVSPANSPKLDWIN